MNQTFFTKFAFYPDRVKVDSGWAKLWAEDTPSIQILKILHCLYSNYILKILRVNDTTYLDRFDTSFRHIHIYENYHQILAFLCVM